MQPTADNGASGWDCHVHVFDAAAPVRPGHYIPSHRPLDQIERLAAGQGVGHLVLVQPSVYGTDHTVLLRALQAGGGRHRGIAVIDPAISEAELDGLHEAGVRGVRFNLVSPAGHGGAADELAADLARLAPQLRARGWHVQWYTSAERLPQLAAWQSQTGLRFVLDHLAGLNAGLVDANPDTDPAWQAAQALADGGAWIKLSGWYRLGASAPYAALEPAIRRVATMFGPRMVWGSDWPHTSFAADRLPAYESNLEPVRAALGEAALLRVLRGNARSLYAGR